MKCNYYIDVKIKNMEDEAMTSSILPPIVKISGKVIKSLHSFNKTTEDKNKNKIAVAFPGYKKEYRKFGNTIRLFAEEKSFLETFSVFLNNASLGKNIDVSGVKDVKVNEVINYNCFISHKLKKQAKMSISKRTGESMFSGINPDNYSSYYEKLHKYPNLRFVSQTNNNHFSLFIERKVNEYFSQTINDEGELTSYGFSKKLNPVFLPFFK